MSVAQLMSVMTAAELAEWGAYYMLQDEEQNKRIHAELAEEASDEEKFKIMRSLFKRIK